MTSLIFGSIYLGHKGIVNHRREKQRQKNYQRWEGLRDEYDEQRKISRESRSLDIQRTGADYSRDVEIDRPPILTLRDQQEANDARTGWRPQETWDGPTSPQPDRRTSVEVTSGSGLRPVSQHKTGSTWDDGLPQPLRVSRRNWDEYQPSSLSANVSRSGSLRDKSTADTPARDRSVSHTPPSVNKQPSPQRDFIPPSTTTRQPDHRSVSMPTQPSVDAVEYATPGGLMAELIESGNTAQTQRQQSPYPQSQQTPFSQSYQSPFPPSQQTPFSQSQQTPFSQSQQTPFSQPQQTPFGGFQANPYASTPPAPQSQAAGMQEWWNRPL